ncbi:MAG: hypothetical protein ABIN66_09175 [candidate division WOR-3 bacterium]
MLILLIALDTLRLVWPDTIAHLRPHFKDSIRIEPESPFGRSGDTIWVSMNPGDTALVIYEPLPYDWTRPRVLFPLIEAKPESIRVLERDTGGGGLAFSGEKTIGITFSGAGPFLDDVTRLSVSGRTGGVELDGYMEETGFSGSEFTGELEEIDKAYLTASGGLYAMTLGNLRKELLMGGSYGSLKFLGVSGVAGSSEAFCGYQRGNFTIRTFSGSDAYQGPYQLTEPGQLITPNSERIYLNGELLKPGPDADYILDVFTGTLVFTARRPIRAEDRILCEFQVSESGKSSYFGAGSLTAGPWRFEGFGTWDEMVFSEGLDSLGDTSWAWVSGARHVGPGKGSYTKQDSIYIYVGPGKGDWDVSFSYMGQGLGDYIYDNLLGGYRFVGSGFGDYSPLLRLSPPARKAYAGLEFRKQNEGFSFLGFARVSDHDRNRFSSVGDEDNRGADLGLEASFWGQGLSAGLAGEWRDSSFSYPFSGLSGSEDRIWGVSDGEGMEKRGGWGWLELRPLDWITLRPEAGILKMAGISSFRRGGKFRAGAFSISHSLVTMSTASWMALSEARVSGSRDKRSASLGLGRETGDTLNVWRADASVSSETRGVLWSTSGLWRLDYRRQEKTLWLGLAGQNWDGSYILRSWSGDSVFTEHHLSGGLNLSAETRGFWARGRLSRSARHQTQERFVYVGPGQGEWEYDSSSGSFYPYPGGPYIRQIIYLEATAPATERGAEIGAWGLLMGTSVSLSVSGAERLSEAEIYYSDYSGNLLISRTGKGLRPFAELYGSRLSDAQGYVVRAMSWAGGKTGIRFRAHEPGFEGAYENSILGAGIEREVVRGLIYYRRAIMVGLDLRGSFGRMRASEPIYNPGVTAWLWELGFSPQWTERLGRFFFNINPQLFYRWGERDAQLSQVFAVYPPGLSYILSASVKMGEGGSLTFSGFLRGDEAGLRDRRLSVYASIVF